MTITTKKGDKGKSCWKGITVDKDGMLLETIGGMDELSAIFQLIGARFGESRWGGWVRDLGKIMGMLVCGRKCDLESRIGVMEKDIREGEKNLSKIGGFVSFKTEKGSTINWARTVSRRVERKIVALSKKRRVEKEVLKYFNRLSDYLFVLARKAE